VPARDVAFRAKVKQAGEVLHAISLLAHANAWPPAYAGIGKDVRKQPYRKEWEHYESRSLFDFKLTDGSLLQFKDAPEAHTEASFCFYESPLAVDDFETFVVMTYDTTAANLGDLIEIAQDEYEAYLSSAGLKKAIAAIRYDFSPPLYREGCHPASHVHVGHGNEVRIGTRRVMNPVSFTLFVLRQVYPNHWTRLLALDEATEHIKHVRQSLELVDSEFQQAKDAWELHLD
jgi:hypothetical protein